MLNTEAMMNKFVDIHRKRANGAESVTLPTATWEKVLDLCEAAQWLANDRSCMPIEQSLMMPASVDAVINAKARLDALEE